MAKQQTFGDKLKKKKIADSGISVKVVKAYRTEIGNLRFMEKFIKVSDLSELEKVEVNK